MKVTKNLTEGNIYKNLLFFALPLIVSSLLSQAYSTIDGVIAGKFISEYALGAISATASYETLFFALFQGFAAGFSIYVAHLFGEKRYADIKRDVVGMLVFVSAVSILISILTVLLRTPIMHYLKVDPLLWRDAEIYFVIYTAGFVLLFSNSFFVLILQSLGISSYSLYVSILSAILNIIGNLVTVLVLDLGVAGLAMSTLFSSLTATVIYVVMLRKAFSEMPSERISYRFSLTCVKRSLHYSGPASIQQLAFHGVAFLISPSINALGAAATTGYNVAARIYTFGTNAMWATTSAFNTYTGQSVGTGSVKKIKRGLRVGLLMNALLILPFIVFFMILAQPIASIFFPDGYVGEAYQYAVRYARIYLPMVYIQLVGHVLHSYMRCLGAISTVLGITIVGSFVRVVATLLWIPLLHIEGAFIGQVVSWGADALLSIALYLRFYRSDAHILRSIERTHRRIQSQ